ALEFWGAVVNFTLLVIILRRLSKAPLAKFLEDRRERIDRGIREASQVKAKAEAVYNEYTERLKTLDQELSKLRSDIAKAAADDRARIVADAEETAKRVKAETEQLVARQAEQLEADIRREVVQAAIDAAERAVRESVNADDQRRLAEAFAKELAKVSKEKRV
ncbi:MAG TPA: ATP synthase F0 subunit B, partial [Polyangiales bacterium]|nr:ATP synthase F0 subunit B [Polyangiales bacterium]